MTPEEKYQEISADAEELFESVLKKMAMPFDVSFQLVCCNTQKNLIKLSKVSDIYSYLTKKQVLVIFNDYFVTTLDKISAEILVQQELDKIDFDTNNGTIKLKKPELSTSVGVIKKYGIEEVARANQLEDLVARQKQDSDSDQATREAVADRVEVRGFSRSNGGVDFLED